MALFTVEYQISPAPRTFYPAYLTVEANSTQKAKEKAARILRESVDFSEVEKVTITRVIPV